MLQHEYCWEKFFIGITSAKCDFTFQVQVEAKVGDPETALAEDLPDQVFSAQDRSRRQREPALRRRLDRRAAFRTGVFSLARFETVHAEIVKIRHSPLPKYFIFFDLFLPGIF